VNTALEEMSARLNVTTPLRRIAKLCLPGILLAVCSPFAHAQRERGELRVAARDAQGDAVAVKAELLCESAQFHKFFNAGGEGRFTAQDLPFGTYRVTLSAEGFASWNRLVEIRSELPVQVLATLGVAPLSTQVRVTDSATLVDSSSAATIYSIGRESLNEQISVQPGRDLSDLVSDLPGWLYEANGVLHPRGSEYDIQYVFDGLPLTQNRSPAFAPALDADQVESVRVLTASFPAEYGRKLGGIVEVTTVKDAPKGLHGQVDVDGGSFGTASASAGLSYSQGQNHFSASATGFHTDRYLDPPVLQNFTNGGNADGFAASFERDFSNHDRLRVSFFDRASRFLVPNELVQEQAGQRQDVGDSETGGQATYQHTFSPSLFFSVSGSLRDSTEKLASNSLSVPVIASQQRGFREGYFRSDVAGHYGHNDWKVGADSIFDHVHEALQYQITDAAQFDPGTQQQLNFAARHWDIEPSAYIQDAWHRGNWNVSGGVRLDLYRFVVHESALSPRVGVSRYVAPWNLLIHASYDRVFQTPATENLLLASSPQLSSVDPNVLRLPVQAARANYYEAAITKSLFGHLRMDASVFRRDFRNYSDDDVLFDTGVSFPIAFYRARIAGEEVRLALPHWGRFSGSLSYSNQSGVGQGPVTGGLFVGDDATKGLTGASRFAVSQDQRNTFHARVRYEATRRVWLAMSAGYGSGLPVEIDPNLINPPYLLSQYGEAILSQVNFNKERVRPNYSLDLASGVALYQKEKRSANFEIQAANLTDHVNVINFESVFSGTAVAPPRSVSARLRLAF
jgi:hypothetical protein